MPAPLVGPVLLAVPLLLGIAALGVVKRLIRQCALRLAVELHLLVSRTMIQSQSAILVASRKLTIGGLAKPVLASPCSPLVVPAKVLVSMISCSVCVE